MTTGSLRPGPTNSLTDVADLQVGSYEKVGDGYLTGTTVVVSPDTAVCGVDVRGAAPGTRETDLLEPGNLVERVNAVVLSGGSAYGLAAATSVMTALGDRGQGFRVGANPDEVVPIVPGAVIFDLGRGGTFRAHPDAAFGAEALARASAGAVRQGSVGAATGAVAGGLKGGLGSASVVLPGGITVAALAVVNAAGSTIDRASGLPYGLSCGLADEFAGVTTPTDAEAAALRAAYETAGGAFNTTIGVVATDAVLDKAACRRFATVAHDGLAWAIRPAHRMVDGDAIFGLATGRQPLPADPLARLGTIDAIFAAGAECFARAVVHAVLRATTAGAFRSYGELAPSAVAGWAGLAAASGPSDQD